MNAREIVQMSDYYLIETTKTKKHKLQEKLLKLWHRATYY